MEHYNNITVPRTENSSGSLQKRQLLFEPKGEFTPDGWWILVYYILIPALVPFGLLGNILCIKVVLRKFSKEIGFLYQAVIMVVDTCALVFILLQVSGYYWGLGHLAVARKQVMSTAYWFERSYVLRFCLQVIFDPLRHLFITMEPLLLIGVGIDRIISLAAPIYYRTIMRRKVAFISVIVVSFVLGILTGLDNILFLHIEEVKVNTTDSGVVSVYKRAGNRAARETNLAHTLSILNSSMKSVGMIGVLIVSATVLILFWRQQKKHGRIAPGRGSDKAQTTVQKVAKDHGPVDHKLLSKLMLMQCALVCMTSLPHVAIHTQFYLPRSVQMSQKVFLFIIKFRDLGYVMQASLNVLVYIGVSKRFRKATHALLFGEKQGESVPAANVVELKNFSGGTTPRQ